MIKKILYVIAIILVIISITNIIGGEKITTATAKTIYNLKCPNGPEKADLKIFYLQPKDIETTTNKIIKVPSGTTIYCNRTTLTKEHSGTSYPISRPVTKNPVTVGDEGRRFSMYASCDAGRYEHSGESYYLGHLRIIHNVLKNDYHENVNNRYFLLGTCNDLTRTSTRYEENFNHVVEGNKTITCYNPTKDKGITYKLKLDVNKFDKIDDECRAYNEISVNDICGYKNAYLHIDKIENNTITGYCYQINKVTYEAN